MILVTGATGALGGAVIDHLLDVLPASQIAGLVRDPGKATDLSSKGIDLRSGDYNDIRSLVSAFRGLDRLLLVSTVAFTDAFKQHTNVINAAGEAGVKHIIFTSVQRSNKTKYIVPWVTESSEKTERYLAGSGIDFTIVRNTFYADNLTLWIGKNWLTDGIQIPAGNGRVPYAIRSDLAEAIFRILIEPIHAGKTYTLTNSQTYSFADIATMFSEFSGRDIPFRDVPALDFINRMKHDGYPEPVALFWSQWAASFRDGYMDEVDTTLEKLLKRKPLELSQYLKERFFKNLV